MVTVVVVGEKEGGQEIPILRDGRRSLIFKLREHPNPSRDRRHHSVNQPFHLLLMPEQRKYNYISKLTAWIEKLEL